MSHYDVIVIGCGPAGQKAAIKCAKIGRRVALIDDREVVGGRCLHTGTIPSKCLRAAIIYLSGYYERKIYGEDYRVMTQDITIHDLLIRAEAIIEREIGIIHNELKRNSIAVIAGQAVFTDPHQVRICPQAGEQCELSADNFIICTGSVAHIEQDFPFDGVQVLNTDDIMRLSYLPQRLLLHGGGIIGLEYASMFGLLGIQVELVSHHTQLLPFVDHQLVEALLDHMQRYGVRFHLGETVARMEVAGPRQVSGVFRSGEAFDVEMAMYAAPRWGNTEHLNLAAAGLTPEARGCLKVNAGYQTAVPHIYAAGDVIGWPSLASTSIDQGRKAANSLLGVPDVPYEPIFPYGIYTFPDISMVGASEEQLKLQGRDYEVGIGRYRNSARGQIIGDEDGLVKLLFDKRDRTLLGVHIIGYEATELIHIGQGVLINKGKIDYFLDTVFNYPTLAEVYKLAALNGFNKTDAALPAPHL